MDPASLFHYRSPLLMAMGRIESILEEGAEPIKHPEAEPVTQFSPLHSWTYPDILRGRELLPPRSAVWQVSESGSLMHREITFHIPQVPKRQSSLPITGTQNYTLVKFGDCSRFAIKAARAIEQGDEVCKFKKGTKIRVGELPPLAHLGSLGPSEPSSLLNSGKVLAALDSQENPSPSQERVLQGQIQFALANDAESRPLEIPFYTVFIPTMFEREANVEMNDLPDEKRYQILATKTIEPDDPLRIWVTPKMYMRWCEDLLMEKNDRSLGVDRFAFQGGDEEHLEKISRVVKMDQLFIPEELRDEWEIDIHEYRKENPNQLFETMPFSQETIYLTNQLVLKEILDALNPGQESLFPEALEIRFISNKVGYGAYARRDLHVGEYIGVYMGIVTKDEEDDSYAYAVDSQSEHMQSWFISAKTYGSAARYVNHANSKQAECNASSIRIIFGDRVYYLYEAEKEIAEGEEVRINYGPEYWKTKGQIPLRQFKENEPKLINLAKRKKAEDREERLKRRKADVEGIPAAQG